MGYKGGDAGWEVQVRCVVERGCSQRARRSREGCEERGAHRVQESHRRPFTGFSEAPGHLRKTGKRVSNGLSRAVSLVVDDALEEGCLMVMPNARTEAPALRHHDVECGFVLDI